MLRKCLFVLLIAIVTIGAAFAQEEANESIETSKKNEVREKGGAKNTIVADVGPTILSLGMVEFAKSQLEGDGFEPTGFGIGVQYERQINNKFAIAGRFAYFGFGMQFSKTEGTETAHTGTDIYAITVEAHARYYPFGGTFFLSGILGYTNMGIKASGSILVEDGGTTEAVSANHTFSRDFVKLGAKLGWRIRSGKSNGGFTFEPSLGWDFGFSPSDTFGKQLVDYMNGEGYELSDADGFDEIFNIIENFVFVGGPRVTLSFGWSF